MTRVRLFALVLPLLLVAACTTHVEEPGDHASSSDALGYACGGAVPEATQGPWPEFGEWFRRSYDYAVRVGYPTAFPNFHEAWVSSWSPAERGPIRGTLLVRPAAGTVFRDVPVRELNDGPRERVADMMRASQDYAWRNGFAAGLPTFHEADYGGGPVRGVFLFPESAVEFRDVPACELAFPNPNDAGAMLRSAYGYAVRKGYVGAFPTFHYATYPGPGLVYGLFLLRPGTAEWRDVRRANLMTECGGHEQAVCPDSQCDSDCPTYVGHVNGPTTCQRWCGTLGNPCCPGNACDARYVCGGNGKCALPPRPTPTSGELTFTLTHVAGEPSYKYRATNPPVPWADATIDWVENRDIWAIRVTHTRGSDKAMGVIPWGGRAVAPFAGRLVAGTWDLEVGGPPGTYPATTTLKIGWHKP